MSEHSSEAQDHGIDTATVDAWLLEQTPLDEKPAVIDAILDLQTAVDPPWSYQRVIELLKKHGTFDLNFNLSHDYSELATQYSAGRRIVYTPAHKQSNIQATITENLGLLVTVHDDRILQLSLHLAVLPDDEAEPEYELFEISDRGASPHLSGVDFAS